MPRWVLVLDPPSGDPTRWVGGLPLALRLVLDAQAGGAAGVLITPGAEAARPALADERRRIPLLDAAPPGTLEVRVPASYLVHRQLFKKLFEQNAMPRDLAKQPFQLELPWGFSPFDVSDDETAQRAEHALFQSLRKVEDGWTSRALNRRISLALSRQLVKTPLSPNQVSIGILAIGILGAVLAAQGSYWTMLCGAFLFQMQSVLDGCDGEMSRVTYRGSLTGEWLDTIGDDLTNYGFFAGAGWGLSSMTGNPTYLAAGAVTIVAGGMASAIEYRYLAKIGSGDLNKYPLSAGESSGGAFDRIRPLFKRDTFVLVTLFAAGMGQVGPMLFLFAGGAVAILISVIGAELRMAREGAGGP